MNSMPMEIILIAMVLTHFCSLSHSYMLHLYLFVHSAKSVYTLAVFQVLCKAWENRVCQ